MPFTIHRRRLSTSDSGGERPQHDGALRPADQAMSGEAAREDREHGLPDTA
ncbi:hypothetical protein ACFORH_31165 [Amycolatopsis roodepoortensis]|uniref:Uncharacterized protein n=1 Tax=Amycolatopsis roodepoortensis TaxID=700274 RepID=A0ABR9KZ30_9PSEU|nr:hypothetical protein [Amycolatopsis roodepoortensis]MBE1573162.1 hypothetical protein [Amycolatopsis roodepoortensis]